MATLHSMNDAVGLIVEVTHGTDPIGTPTNFIPIDTCTPSNPQATIRPQTTRRNDAFRISTPRLGRRGPVTLEMAGPATYDAIGLLWHAALGGSSSSGAGDPYTHTYATATPELPSYTAEHIHADVANSVRYSGLRLDALDLSVGTDDDWKWSASWMGISEASPAAKSTITYGSTQLVPTFADCTLTWNSVDLHLYATSIGIKISNGLEARFSTGSKTAREIYCTRDRVVTASVEIVVDSTLAHSFQTAHMAQTMSDLVLTITDPAVSNRSITLTLNDAQLMDSAIAASKGGEMKTLSLSFEARATSAAEAVGVVVVNGVSSAVGNG